MTGREELRGEEERSVSTGYLLVGLSVTVVALAVVVIILLTYNHKAKATVARLNSHQTDLNAQLSSMRDQFNVMAAKLNGLTAAQAAASAKSQAAPAPATKRVTARQPSDSRWKKMQSQLDAQQKQLDDTATSLNQTRNDLAGSIGATRDELNGSIAKTHDELVALEQRGERNYFEFDLSKSKQFQRTGPLSVSLRKADTKHKSYDLALVVDDNQIEKKKVDLYEPIWLRDSEDPQPLEVVVNKIEKNHVHGYVSASKFPDAQRLAGITVPTSSSSTTGVAITPQSN